MRPKALHTRLLDTLTTAILLVDANMRVSYLNPAAETLLGLSRGRVLRENIARIVQEDDDTSSQARTTALPITSTMNKICPNDAAAAHGPTAPAGQARR